VFTGVLVSTSRSVDEDQVRFDARCHPHSERPFVVLVLGSEATTMHVSDPAHLAALGQMVAEAHDLLTAALAGQDPLPVDLTAVPA
jgi:hypothetical protein